MNSIDVSTATPYPVIVGRGLLKEAGEYDEAVNCEGKIIMPIAKQKKKVETPAQMQQRNSRPVRKSAGMLTNTVLMRTATIPQK